MSKWIKCIGGPLDGDYTEDTGWVKGNYHRRYLRLNGREWPVYAHDDFSDPVRCGEDHFHQEILQHCFGHRDWPVPPEEIPF